MANFIPESDQQLLIESMFHVLMKFFTEILEMNTISVYNFQFTLVGCQICVPLSPNSAYAHTRTTILVVELLSIPSGTQERAASMAPAVELEGAGEGPGILMGQSTLPRRSPLGQAAAGRAGAGDGGMEGRQGPVTAGGRAAEGRRLDGGRPCARARDLVGLKLGELTALGRKNTREAIREWGQDSNFTRLSVFGPTMCFSKWPENCNGTQQIHDRVVCLDKDHEITVSLASSPYD